MERFDVMVVFLIFIFVIGVLVLNFVFIVVLCVDVNFIDIFFGVVFWLEFFIVLWLDDVYVV